MLPSCLRPRAAVAVLDADGHSHIVLDCRKHDNFLSSEYVREYVSKKFAASPDLRVVKIEGGHHYFFMTFVAPHSLLRYQDPRGYATDLRAETRMRQTSVFTLDNELEYARSVESISSAHKAYPVRVADTTRFQKPSEPHALNREFNFATIASDVTLLFRRVAALSAHWYLTDHVVEMQSLEYLCCGRDVLIQATPRVVKMRHGQPAPISTARLRETDGKLIAAPPVLRCSDSDDDEDYDRQCDSMYEDDDW
jgi:hypothetical protein